MNIDENSGFTRADINTARPLNVSRRGFLAGSISALVLTVSLPAGTGRAIAQTGQTTPGTRIDAYLEILADSTVKFRSAFVEGGQGIYTAMAQIVGEELDVEPGNFQVETAPPGSDYLLIGGQIRFTGGSMSVRMSYDAMRKLGATARQMLLQAASERLGVPIETLTTEPGKVVHPASGQSIPYGDLATAAADLPVPETVELRLKDEFRWIGKPHDRLDVLDKSTGQAQYAIDLSVDGMLYGAVQHAPRLGQQPGAFANEADVATMPGVHSLHKLPLTSRRGSGRQLVARPDGR